MSDKTQQRTVRRNYKTQVTCGNVAISSDSSYEATDHYRYDVSAPYCSLAELYQLRLCIDECIATAETCMTDILDSEFGFAAGDPELMPPNLDREITDMMERS